MSVEISVSKLAVVLSGEYDITFADLVPFTKQFNLPPLALKYAFGTAAGQINKAYIGARTIGPTLNDDVDLSGSLVSPDGGTILFARVKAVILQLQASPAVALLTLGNEGTNPAKLFFGANAHTLDVRNGPNGGLFCNACGDATGWTVTAATGDKFRVHNPDAALTANYTACFLGCDA